MPILESVTNIAKTNSASQAVNLYYLGIENKNIENDLRKISRLNFMVNQLFSKSINLFDSILTSGNIFFLNNL